MVVVIGAGLAGLSAALHLAERGVEVTLCERHPEFLGGRTRQRHPYRFEHEGRTYVHSLDQGQHCIWWQYSNMRELMTRLGFFASSTRACGYPADLEMWCFRGNLGTHLIDPIVAAARRHGVRILRNAKVYGVDRQGSRIAAVLVAPSADVTSGAGGPEVLDERVRLPCDAVISAADIPGFQAALVPGLADHPEILMTANLETVGNATIRVVTSARVGADEPWHGVFAGRFHFLDAYFLLSRYQDELMAWPGEVIELHSYVASRELEVASPEIARAVIEREVVSAWPALAGKIVHIEYFVNERTCDKQTVAHARFQPSIRTSVSNLFLCGSWVKDDTASHDMEKAVATGIRAASCVLE